MNILFSGDTFIFGNVQSNYMRHIFLKDWI